MKPHQMRKIHWDDSEEYNFLYIYSTLVLDHPGMGIGERIVKAMQVAVDLGKLDVTRVRPFHNTSFLDPYRDKLVLMREKVLKDRHEQNQRAEAEAAVKAMQNPDPALEATIQQVLALLGDKRIQTRLREILVPQPLYLSTAHPKHDPAMTASPPKPKLKKVLIVGLKGIQMETIKRAYSHKFDLKFVDKDANRDIIRENADTHQILVLMVSFCSHDLDSILKRRADKDESKKFVRVNGTITDLQRILAGMEA